MYHCGKYSLFTGAVLGMNYDIKTGGEEISGLPAAFFTGGGRLPKLIVATGAAIVNNPTTAAGLATQFLPLTAQNNNGGYIDATPFSLVNGKIRCSLAGAVWVDMIANAKTNSAQGWLQPYICFDFPDGTVARLQVAHGRTINTTYGITIWGNTFRSIVAGTDISIGIMSGQGGATLGNSYWCKVLYLYTPDTTGG